MPRRALQNVLKYGLVAGGIGLLVLIVANLALGDKRIDQRVSHLYPAADAQFTRSMNVMLGPALLAGNRARTLVNGERIFPEMLEAIQIGRAHV